MAEGVAATGRWLLLLAGWVLVRAEEMVLGIYGPMSSGSNTFLATAIAFDIDFRKNYQDSLRTAYGDPIIKIPDLHPDLTLKTQLGNSNSETNVGVQTNLDWMLGHGGAKRVTGIVGGYHSYISMPVASLAAVFQVPQISWGSTSPLLSNKETYPYFMRTIPPDSIQGAAMWCFVTSFSIPSATFIYSDEPYGAGLFSTVVNLASNNNQAFRIQAVAVPYMPSYYNESIAREEIQRAMKLDSRFVYVAMNIYQAVRFMPVAKAEGLLGTSWQVAGSEAMAFANFEEDDIPVGYMYFTPISHGPLFDKFLNLWTQLTPDDIYGTDAQTYYGINKFLVPLAGQAAPTLVQSDFASGDSLSLEAPFVFDAAYAFVVATNNLLNAGIAMANITGQILLDAIKTLEFEGISGQVAFDANGDRLASYQINNVQESGGGKVTRVAAVFSSVTETFTMVDGVDLYWMDGNPSATVPDHLVACRPGHFAQAVTGRCQACAPNTYSLGGVNAACSWCPAGRFQNEAGQSVCRVFDIQLGIYGPMTSHSNNFLAAAVMFDLDFRKNHDSGLRARFGEPIVRFNKLNDNLRIKVQIANSNSDPEVGVGSAFDLFQGQNGVDRIVGFVGGYHSGISMSVTSLGAQFKCPQVSWGSTSPSLSNKEAYPYFLRTIPPDSIQGGGMWKFIEVFQVPVGTFLYTQEAYGEGLFQAVQDNAAHASQLFRVSGVGIRYMPTNYDGNEAAEAIRQCKALGAKVIFLLMPTNQGRLFFPIADRESLLSSKWQLIGSEALQADISPFIPRGYIWFSPVRRGRLFSQFEEMWKMLTRTDVEGAAALAYYSIDQWRVPLDQTAATATRISEDTFASIDGLDIEVPFLFDAAYTFATAFNNLLNAGTPVGEIKEDLLLQAVKAVQFEGISGPVAFDRNGDRMASYMIMNTQPAKKPDSEGRMLRSLTAVVAATYSAATGAITNADDDSQPIEIFWMAGSLGSAVPSGLTACEPGFYKDANSLMCMKCVAGEYSVGGEDTVCRKCPPGTAAECTMEGGLCIRATGCRNCTAGTYAENSGSTTCKSCPLGMYSNSEAAAACQLCDLGTWQNELGSTGCRSCMPHEGTRSMASESPAECVCSAGFYREIPGGSCSFDFSSLPPAGSPNRSNCVPCLEGMTCKLGSDMLHYWNWHCFERGRLSSGEQQEHITRFPFPILDASYMSLGEEPLRVFQCNHARRCPGGPPGTCGKTLDVTIRTCAFCQLEWSWSGEACVECTGLEKSGLGIIAGSVVSVLGLIILASIVNQDVASQPRTTSTCALLIGLTFMGLQSVGIFITMDVDWPEPLKTVLEYLQLINFDLRLLKVDCILGAHVVKGFMVRQAVAPATVCFIAFVLVMKHRRRFKKARYMVEFVNTVGAMFQTMFISIAISAWSPFVCFEHPGKHSSSMKVTPSVLCFGDDGYHGAMVAMSVLVCLTILVPFLVLVFYGVVMHRRFVLDAQVNKGYGLMMYRFLFYRFNPAVYYYGAIILMRNLLMCLVPVIFKQGVLQILVLAMIILAGVVLQLSLQPWKSALTNWLDGVMSGCMILLLLCAAINTPFGSVEDFIGMLGVTLMSGFFLAILVSLGCLLYRRLKPQPYYSKFICHHKADAAAQARFLQLCLQARTGKPVFIDSDDLTDLDQLFDIVRSRVGQLVVYLTASTLRRPWCAGEITVSYMTHQRVCVVRMPGFSNPTELEMSNLGSYIGAGSSDLGQYGITMGRVAEAFGWLLSSSVPTVEPQVGTEGRAMFDGIMASILGKKVELCPKLTARGAGVILLASDPSDREATAAAGILCMKLQEKLLSGLALTITMLADEAELTEAKIADLASAADSVIIMFSQKAMESVHQLCAMAISMERSRKDPNFRVVPVSTPNFQFPEEAYWAETFPRLRPHAGKKESAHIRSLFKRICIYFNTSASNQVLEQQAEEVIRRIMQLRLESCNAESQVWLPEDSGSEGNPLPQNIVHKMI